MKKNPKLCYLLSMFIFGGAGIVSHYINATSGLIVLARGIIGTLALFLYVIFIRKTTINKESVKKNLLYLILAGVAIGGNWICLFSTYKKVSVSIGTLFNYLAPALLILFSPFVLKEKPTPKKIICAVFSLSGMVLISGILSGDDALPLNGVLIALGSAVCYFLLLVFNLLIKDIDPVDKVIIEFIFASLTILPYTLITTDFNTINFDFTLIFLLVIMGLVYTCLAYILYLGSMPYLSSESVAICSYVEPVTSIIFSILVLSEPASFNIIAGSIIVLGSTFISEISFSKLKTKSRMLL